MHSKGNYQENEKAAYWMGEDIGKQCFWWEVNTQNIQRTHTIQHQTTQLKNRGSNYQGNANQTTMRHHLTALNLSEWLSLKKKERKNKYWRRNRVKGNFCALLVGMQIGIATMENNMNVTQKNFKKNYIRIQQFYF